MTLHDRIMDLPKGLFAGYEYAMGYEAACETAAVMATEADELMAQMAEALAALRHEMMESGNYHADDFGWPEAKAKTEGAIAKYNTYMERNNEQ